MERREEILACLRDLIALNTENPPGREAAAAEYLEGVLRQAGISARQQPVAPGRSNLVAVLGPQDGKTLVWNGHLDVVAPGEGWRTDPFALCLQEGLGLGRGACDMKGSVAAMVSAALSLKKRDVLHHVRLILALTCDEEVHGSGTAYFLAHCPLPPDTRVILGEPTDMRIQTAHRGVIRLKLTARGRQCHSAEPQRGANAICALGRLLRGVEAYHARRQALRPPVLPAPTVSCTMIQGGVKDNVIPPEAECVLDCRTIPGDTPEKLMAELDEILRQIELPAHTDYAITPLLEMPPALTAPDCGTVRLAQRALAEQAGLDTAPGIFPGCSDMPQFTGRGWEAILWGPGSMEQAHRPNESVKLDELYRMSFLYERFLELAEQEAAAQTEK
jgi:acetylornithine deacetylase/succinyl-diaminopimelate desuccinylase family protein